MRLGGGSGFELLDDLLSLFQCLDEESISHPLSLGVGGDGAGVGAHVWDSGSGGRGAHRLESWITLSIVGIGVGNNESESLSVLAAIRSHLPDIA